MEIKKEMKLKIFRHKFDENDLVKLSTEDFKDAKWINDEEVVYNGKMYDLVKTKLINNKKIYFLLPDHLETNVKNYQTQIASIFKIKKLENLVFKTSVVNYSASHTHFIFPKTYLFLPEFYDSDLKSNFRIPGDYSLNLIFYTDIPPEFNC